MQSLVNTFLSTVGLISFHVLPGRLYGGKVTDACFECCPLFLLALRRTGGAEWCCAVRDVSWESWRAACWCRVAQQLQGSWQAGALLWEDVCPDVHFYVIISRPSCSVYCRYHPLLCPQKEYSQICISLLFFSPRLYM